MKHIKYIVEVPIFNRAVVFVGNCSPEKAAKVIYKIQGKDTKITFTPTADGCVRDFGGDVFVWVRDLSKASVVAHELAHAACSIMEICHIPLCGDTEELMCFLIGWLKIHVQDEVYTKLEQQEKKRR